MCYFVCVSICACDAHIFRFQEMFRCSMVYNVYVSSEISELTLERLVWLNVWVVSSAPVVFKSISYRNYVLYTFLPFPFLSALNVVVFFAFFFSSNIRVLALSAKFYTKPTQHISLTESICLSLFFRTLYTYIIYV